MDPDTNRPRLSIPGTWPAGTSLPALSTLPSPIPRQPSATHQPSCRSPSTPGPPHEDRRHGLEQPQQQPPPSCELQQQQQQPSFPQLRPPAQSSTPQQKPTHPPPAPAPPGSHTGPFPPPPPLAAPPAPAKRVQDPHCRLSATTAHPPPPPYTTYPSAEPVLKRDPSDDTMRRTDVMTPTPHGISDHPNPQPLPPPPPPLPPPSRQIGYESGPPPTHMGPSGSAPVFQHPGPPGPSGAPGTTPSFPLPSHMNPQPPPQTLENVGVYSHPVAPQDIAYGIQYTTATSGTKRKTNRATQACDSCRQLKAKCDEQKPCTSCKDKNIDCKYREMVPKPQDKVASRLLDGIDQILNRLVAIEKLIHPNANLTGCKPKPAAGGTDVKSGFCATPENDKASYMMEIDGPLAGELADEVASGVREETPITEEKALQTIQALDEEGHEIPGEYVAPGELAIPLNHTTPAHRLLVWPPIWRLVEKHLEKEMNIKYLEEFPLRQEIRRGMLKVFGRGEGIKSGVSTNTEQVGVEVMDDYASDVASSLSSDGRGQLDSFSPPAYVDVLGGPISNDRNPDYSESTVWKYVESCLDNVLSIHPLISKNELQAFVKIFLATLRRVPPPKNNKDAGVALWPGPHEPMATVPAKRKWSPSLDGPAQVPQMNSSKTSCRPLRCINNCLVLLCLALGKASLHQQKIPDPVPPTSDPYATGHGSSLLKNGASVTPVPMSPVFPHSSSSALPSPKDATAPEISRRHSMQGYSFPKAAHPGRRNYDVIPGLEYFALATNILGNEEGGVSIKYVWAHILAALYHGQIGRVHESWSYVQNASKRILILIAPKLARFNMLRQSGQLPVTQEDNQLLLAFWTTLQMESDIIAELPYMASYLLNYEDTLPYPRSPFFVNAGFSERVVQSYFAQLYLRKHLNTLHRDLYQPGKAPEPKVRQGLEQALNPVSRWVPPCFKFRPEDGPATDLLSARLRAKYWGAMVITYRQFARHILEVNAGVVPADSKTITMGPITEAKAALAITALKESTRAFWGVGAADGKRMVVTNIFGTAQAQWGNLLTLAACYCDPMLSKYVDRDELRLLYSKTVRFIDLHSASSSALAIGVRLLRGIGRDLLNMSVRDFDFFELPPGKTFTTPVIMMNAALTAADAPVLPAVSTVSTTPSVVPSTIPPPCLVPATVGHHGVATAPVADTIPRPAR